MTSPKEQEILNRFKVMRADLQSLAEKIGNLEAEKEEHKLVIETLKPLDRARTCRQLINGVLVERNVGEVLPSLELTHKNLGNMIEVFVKTFGQKQKEMVEYQEKYQIKIEPQ